LGAVRISTPLLAVLLVIGCHGEQVLMATAPTGGNYEWREPVELASVVHVAAELPVPVDRPVGYAEARQRPLSAYGIGARIRWNRAVSSLCGRYGELCAAHNNAQISVQEFEARLAELDAITQTLGELRPDFLKAVSDYDKAEALLASDVTPGERPPGVSPAVAHSLMEDSRVRATLTVRTATETVDGLVAGAEDCLVPQE
jgi:hypothetical protein